jgi:hypothetical protein
MYRLLALVPLLASAACTGAVRAPAAPVPAARPEPTPPPMTLAPAITTRQRLQGVLDSVLAAPMWRNARWGVLVVDPVAGDTLVSHDADRLFMPASNQKLLTGAIAVERLGPDYRWRTPVLLHGRQRDGRWVGTLQVAGSGDPSVSDALQGGDARRAFAPVAAALAARGITRVSGDIVAVGDAFPGLPIGYGWAYDDFDEPYSAAVDELLFNEGVHTVWVWGGARAGARVHTERRPTTAYPPLTVRATTRARGEAGAPLLLAHDSTGRTLLLTGTIPIPELGVALPFFVTTGQGDAVHTARAVLAGRLAQGHLSGVAPGDVFGIGDGKVAECGRQAVGAMLERYASQRRKCGRQTRGQRDIALAAEHDFGMFEAGIGHRKVIETVGCRFPLRSDPVFPSRIDPGDGMSRRAGFGSSW